MKTASRGPLVQDTSKVENFVFIVWSATLLHFKRNCGHTQKSYNCGTHRCTGKQASTGSGPARQAMARPLSLKVVNFSFMTSGLRTSVNYNTSCELAFSTCFGGKDEENR